MHFALSEWFPLISLFHCIVSFTHWFTIPPLARGISLHFHILQWYTGGVSAFAQWKPMGIKDILEWSSPYPRGEGKPISWITRYELGANFALWYSNVVPYEMGVNYAPGHLEFTDRELGVNFAPIWFNSPLLWTSLYHKRAIVDQIKMMFWLVCVKIQWGT